MPSSVPSLAESEDTFEVSEFAMNFGVSFTADGSFLRKSGVSFTADGSFLRKSGVSFTTDESSFEISCSWLSSALSFTEVAASDLIIVPVGYEILPIGVLLIFRLIADFL